MCDSGSWVMGENPCRFCTEETGRSADPNCHGYCERFLEWEKQKNDRKIKIRDEKVKFGRLQAIEQSRKRRINKRTSRSHK